jgi:thiamine pyrophosphokinase
MPAEGMHLIEVYKNSFRRKEFFVRAVIFANGKIENHDEIAALMRSDDYVIAADGGAEHCQVLNVNPDAVIGDMDSITPLLLEKLRKIGAKIVSYPPDKDKTDLELAISYAQQIGADEIMLLGILGGRLDMSLANIHLLAKEEWNNISITVIEGMDTAYIISPGDLLLLAGKTGNKVSLIPLSGKVDGVFTKGLRWKLHDDVLYFGDTRGVSNELSTHTGEIKIRSGKLLVVHRPSKPGFNEE